MNEERIRERYRDIAIHKQTKEATERRRDRMKKEKYRHTKKRKKKEREIAN
jgi:hypothetical protein